MTVNSPVTTLAPVAELKKIKNLGIYTGSNNRDESSLLSKDEMRHQEGLTQMESFVLGNVPFTGVGCRFLAGFTRLEKLALYHQKGSRNPIHRTSRGGGHPRGPRGGRDLWPCWKSPFAFPANPALIPARAD